MFIVLRSEERYLIPVSIVREEGIEQLKAAILDQVFDGKEPFIQTRFGRKGK